MSEAQNAPWVVQPHHEDGFLVLDASGKALFWTYTKEDAALTAAGPDLLSSLKELAEEVDFEIEQRQHSGNDEDWLDLKAKSDRAHAAIAKAEGLS